MRRLKYFIFVILFSMCCLGAYFLAVTMQENQKQKSDIKNILVNQTGKIHEQEAPAKSDFEVTAVLNDGSRNIITDYNFAIHDDKTVYIEKDGILRKLTVEYIPVYSLEAFYSVPFYEGSAFDVSNVFVTATYADGYKKQITVNEESVKWNKENNTAEISTEFGQTELKMNPIQATHVTAEYIDQVHAGDSLKKSNFRVIRYYRDGKTREMTDFTVSDLGPINQKTDVIVTTDLGETNVAIEPIAVDSVHPVLNKPPKTGDALNISALTCVYQDGYVKTLSSSDIDFITQIDKELSGGENTYKLNLYGKQYSFSVNAKLTSNVEDAKKYLKEEADSSLYTHITDNIFVTINEKTTDLYHYYLAHIIINDPSQLQSEMSYNSYGGQRELPTDAAKRLNWVIGVNGSNFDYATGRPTYAGAVIKNRQVMEGTQTNGMEICLMSNGVLFSPDAGVDPYKLVLSDVTDSWSCGDTLLIDDGKAVNVGIQSYQFRYPRTAVGMVQPCEYYLLVSGTHDYKGGMSYDEVRDTLMSHGCTFGKCMDGGGSSSLVFEGKLINNPAVNNEERAVSDFLFFTE